MFDYLCEGDKIMVTELYRFGRSAKDLLELANRIEMKGANFKNLKEPWVATTTPQDPMLFRIYPNEESVIRLLDALLME
jgi:DNA invertase Pin-like site-specific DNA recombinase